MDLFFLLPPSEQRHHISIRTWVRVSFENEQVSDVDGFLSFALWMMGGWWQRTRKICHGTYGSIRKDWSTTYLWNSTSTSTLCLWVSQVEVMKGILSFLRSQERVRTSKLVLLSTVCHSVDGSLVGNIRIWIELVLFSSSNRFNQ